VLALVEVNIKMASYRNLLVRAVVGAAVSLLFLNLPPLYAEDISWGATVSGMRVGINIGDGTVGKELRVAFENRVAMQQSLLVAQQGGHPPPAIAYVFDIHAVGGPNGAADYPIFYWVDSGLGQLVPIGLVSPIVAAVPAGRTYQVSIPLKLLFRIAKGDNNGLEDLLHQGYKVRVSYSLGGGPELRSVIAHYPDLWTGEIKSADVGLP
jgi:hypothetical protein